jgi:hypothetical protein
MPIFWGTINPFGTAEDIVGTQSAGAARSAEASVRALQTRLDRTMLACETMWAILSEKLGVTEEDFVAKMNEIDLLDGQLDGKVRKTAVSCPSCNRTISARFAKCMYCGQGIVHDPFA